MDNNKNPLQSNKSIVKEDIAAQFVDLVDRKGKELEKKTYPLQNPLDIAKSDIILERNLYKLNTITDLKDFEKCLEPVLQIINKNYQYVRKIGTGGEAFVILVKDSVLNSFVILKIAKPYLQGKRRRSVWNFSLSRHLIESEDATQKKRFIRGASLQRQLNGTTQYGYIPNVYAINDNPLHIAMEFVQGLNFFEFIKKNKDEINIKIFLNLLYFINEIHSYGIIHRDLKPANILIREDGAIYLLDFTTCKEFANEDENLTGIGYQIGTKMWASPRQMVDAGKCNFQDDIFSLGLLLYVILTKKIPEPLSKISNGEIKVLENLEEKKDKSKFIKRISQDLTSEWQNIFLKATAIEEKNRYKLLDEFIKEYEKLLNIHYEDTIVKKSEIEMETSQGTSKQYTELEKKVIEIENKFLQIAEIIKNL